ncbi:MAG TPA: oligosaccharide flippase family protein [Chitinispirillaceae bacterium]|nr:oligosaccharide flippase family protein [Chitinispirillaceae bacterium]
MTIVNEKTLNKNSESLENKVSGKTEDSVGMANNVIWSWIGHSVFILAGFLLPRFMDRKLGSDMLGLWDFAWSFVGYLQLMQFDVGSSVNRYVAKYRAVDDTESLNTAVTSVMLLQVAMASVILLATCAIIYSLPYLWKDKLGDLIPEARVLIFLLGASTAFSFGFGSFSGVITGCHRWKLYNIINSGYHMGGTLVMIATLFIFNDLTVLAIVYVCENVLISFTYFFAAHAVCKNLKVQMKSFKFSMAMSMLKFGGKGFASSMARTLLYQTNNMLIIQFLGPVSLALYARPINLINRVKTFSSKFANTLTPIASQMQAKNDIQSIEKLVFKMGLFGVCIGLPVAVYFVIMGGPLMLLWMGEKYNNGLLVAVLAIGHLMTISNMPLYTILMGLNSHGRPAFFNCIAGVFSVLLSFVLLSYFKMSVIAVAVSISCSLLVSDGIYMPIIACKKLNVSYRRYALIAWRKAIVYCIPFTAVLLLSRHLLPSLNGLAIGTVVGGIVLLASYWQGILTTEQKKKIIGRLFRSAKKQNAF